MVLTLHDSNADSNVIVYNVHLYVLLYILWPIMTSYQKSTIKIHNDLAIYMYLSIYLASNYLCALEFDQYRNYVMVDVSSLTH